MNSEKDSIVTPGGLLKIFGLGILIIGDSGIGKSESALELISRGHQFISDDATQFRKTGKGKLVGSAPAVSRHFMEVRGLGIINIKEIFGTKSICRQMELNLVITLKKWQEGKKYDRLGLKFPEDYDILEEKVSQVSIPVAPGRNMATLIEIACKVFICREKGYNALQEIIQRMNRIRSVH